MNPTRPIWATEKTVADQIESVIAAEVSPERNPGPSKLTATLIWYRHRQAAR